MTGERTSSWDILQETNLTLWSKRGEFQKGTNFPAWAFTTARFKTLSHFRDKQRDPHQFLTPEILESMGDELDSETRHANARSAALEHCHTTLTAKSRDLLQLYYHENRSLDQIGQKLGSSANALKQALFRIRQQLRECIDNQLQRTP
jgi:RNA polymerase sigma-70 factor (ECF subfamily)